MLETISAWFGTDVVMFRRVVSLIIIFIITIVTAKLAKRVLKNSMGKPIILAHGKIHYRLTDDTRYRVVSRLLVVMIYVIGIAIVIFSIPELRTLSLSLLAGAGVLAVVVGFATQKTFSNIISGIFIAMFEPFKVGDRVIFDDEFGTVQDVTLGHTIIQTWDNRSIVVPNAKMSDEVFENYTHEDTKILKHLDVGIAYDADIDLAKRVMIEEAVKHPDFHHVQEEFEMLSKGELVKVRVIDWEDSSIKLRLYFWSTDPAIGFKMKCDLLEAIKKRFDKEGVEIPYPHRTVVYKKDLPKNRKVVKKKTAHKKKS